MTTTDLQVDNKRNNLVGPRWVKGQSGNPLGRPKKTKSISDILNKIGSMALTEEARGIIKNPWAKQAVTFEQAIMRVTYVMALRGESWAVQFIAERTEGKAVQAFDIMSDNGPLVAIIQNVDVVKAAENITEGKVIDVMPEDPSTLPQSP